MRKTENSRRPRLAALLTLLVAVGAMTWAFAGCAHMPSNSNLPSASQAPASAGAAFVVDVVNPTDQTMDVSYNTGGVVTALGPVPPGGTVRFTIPNHGSDSFEILGKVPDQPAPIHHQVDLKPATPTKVVMNKNEG